MRRFKNRRSQVFGLRRFRHHGMGGDHSAPERNVTVGRQKDRSGSGIGDRARSLDVLGFSQNGLHDHDIELLPGQCLAKMRQWGDRHLTWQGLAKHPLHLHRDQILVLGNENTERRWAHEHSFCQGRFMGRHLINVI